MPTRCAQKCRTPAPCGPCPSDLPVGRDTLVLAGTTCFVFISFCVSWVKPCSELPLCCKASPLLQALQSAARLASAARIAMVLAQHLQVKGYCIKRNCAADASAHCDVPTAAAAGEHSRHSAAESGSPAAGSQRALHDSATRAPGGALNCSIQGCILQYFLSLLPHAVAGWLALITSHNLLTCLLY